jgi:hypothetical protein
MRFFHPWGLTMKLLILLFFVTMATAKASTDKASFAIVELHAGTTHSTQDLIAQGHILIVVKKDCLPCQSYLKEIATCDQKLQSRLRMISTDPAKTARQLAAEIPAAMPFYVLKGKERPQSITATPLTLSSCTSTLGPLSCSEINKVHGC